MQIVADSVLIIGVFVWHGKGVIKRPWLLFS
jgi:hypothetical protein